LKAYLEVDDAAAAADDDDDNFAFSSVWVWNFVSHFKGKNIDECVWGECTDNIWT
jgi:hypothetical protein